MFRVVFVAVSVLLFSMQVQASPGFRQITLSDIKGEPLDVAVWYPAGQKKAAETVGENAAFVGVTVILNAPPTSGAHPLLVISHGFNGSWRNLAWLAVAMAEQGYIVAAPDHPGTTTFNQNSDEARKLWKRPREISRVIDFISHSADLFGTTDNDRIAALGHSLGGWTVMSLAGARFEPSLFLHDCLQQGQRGDCKLTKKLGIEDVAAYKNGSSDSRDARVKAVVSLDLGLAPGFTAQSLGEINIPVLILAASNDKLASLPASQESGYVAANMRASLRQYKVIKGATHFSFMQLCKPDAEKLIEEGSPGDGIVCQDDKGASRAELHQQMSSNIMFFLSSALDYQAPAVGIE